MPFKARRSGNYASPCMISIEMWLLWWIDIL